MLSDPVNGFNSFCLFLQNVIASIKITSKSSTRKQPVINDAIHRAFTARCMEKLRLKLITLLWWTQFNNTNQGCKPARLPAEDFSLYYFIVCAFLFPLRDTASEVVRK